MTEGGVSPHRTLVIGVGNALRSDDAAGLAVVRTLRDRGADGAELLEYRGELLALLDLWAGRERAIVVDAVRSGAPPGTVHRFDASMTPLPASVGATSTHGLSLSDAVELGRAAHRLPSRLVVFGIEAASTAGGSALSASVSGAVDRTVERILEELRARPGGVTRHA